MNDELDIYFNNKAGELQNTSVLLARSVRRLCYQLQDCSWIDRNIISQFYRAGTSVGSNIREAKYAESRRDFIHKLKIAEKEMAETSFWLGLLNAEPSSLQAVDVAETMELCVSVQKLLRKVILSTKDKGR